MFFMGLHLFYFYLHFNEYYFQYPHILGIGVPLPLIHGPFLLLYVTSLIDRHQHFDPKLLLHFITALAFYLTLLPKLLLSGPEKLHFVFEELPDFTPWYFLMFESLIDISGVVYITWTLLLLRRHHKTIDDNFSYHEQISLKWLRNVILGMAIIWMVVLAANFIDDYNGDQMIYASVVLFIFLIGYYGSRQGIIFTDQFDYPEPGTDAETKSKYQRSGLDKDRSQQYLNQLMDYMEREKPYLDNKMTLPQLASQLERNPNHLSQVINDQLQQNFYDFINRYRVEEFKTRLKGKTAGRYTLLSHALDSGFSSKSSFNDVFKRSTGQTPSEFQRDLTSATQ